VKLLHTFPNYFKGEKISILNLCTMTTLETQNLLPLLICNRCSVVGMFYKPKLRLQNSGCSRQVVVSSSLTVHSNSVERTNSIRPFKSFLCSTNIVIRQKICALTFCDQHVVLVNFCSL
jgi:hypothetical protein